MYVLFGEGLCEDYIVIKEVNKTCLKKGLNSYKEL